MNEGTSDTQRTPAAPSDEPSAAQPSSSPPVADAYIIPRVLAQATLDYLAAQPYREVFALVRAFESLEPLPPDAGRASLGLE